MANMKKGRNSNYSRGKSAKTKKKRYSRKYIVQRRKRNLIVAGMFIVAAILVCLISYISLFIYVAIQNDDTIAEGIYIADQDVGGLTIEEAESKITAMMNSYGSASVVIEVSDLEAESPAIALNELGFDMINEEVVIQEAWEYGKSESLWANFQKLQGLKEETVVYYPNYTVDSELIQTYLDENYAGEEVKYVNASITIEDGEVVIHEGEDGIILDVDSTVEEIEAVLNAEWKGTDLTFQIPLTSQEPAIQVEDLEMVQDVLGSYSTTLSDDGNRYDNVAQAAEYMDGTIVMPGEEISVADVTGPYTEDNGYANAPSYANGEVVNSIGGGICQVSSTMYNAVLEAELEVTQRQAHSMTVSYVSPAMDAAIAGDYKDLKFENNTESPIYISAILSGGTLSVKIYGEETRAENRTIEFESETVSTEDVGTSYSEDSSKSLGTITKVSTGKQKITAVLWKYVYIDGEETESIKVNTSYYSGTESSVTVGTQSSDSEASAIVKAAISSQNIDTINAAITEAKSLISDKAAAAAQAEEDAASDSDDAEE